MEQQLLEIQYHSQKVEFFANGMKFFHQKRAAHDGEKPTVVMIDRSELPVVRKTDGVEVAAPDLPYEINPSRPPKPTKENVKVMEVMSNLYKSPDFPSEFFEDSQIVTTLSAIRSIMCQWLETSEKQDFFSKNHHFFEMINGKLHMHTSSWYTVATEVSKKYIHLYRLTGSHLSWQDFKKNWYFGLAKVTLANGTKIVYTYSIDARDPEGNLLEIGLRNMQRIMTSTHYYFLNCFFTGKTIWNFMMNREVPRKSCFEYTIDRTDLARIMSPKDRQDFLRMMNVDLPNFFTHLMLESNAENLRLFRIRDVFCPLRILAVQEWEEFHLIE